MPSYSIKMDVPRGGVCPSKANPRVALGNGDGRWPWARPEKRTMAASPNGVPMGGSPKPPRRPKNEMAGFPWGTNGPDSPSLSGGPGVPGPKAHLRPLGQETPGPWYDLERAGGKHRSFSNSIEFMPQRHALLRQGSEMRFRGEGGAAFGVYENNAGGGPHAKDVGPGQHTQHGVWLDPNIEQRAEPSGFIQGSSVVGDAWGRNTNLRIPVDRANSWLIVQTMDSEPENELPAREDHLRKWKANGAHKGALVLKSSRVMAPWTHSSCKF